MAGVRDVFVKSGWEQVHGRCGYVKWWYAERWNVY